MTARTAIEFAFLALMVFCACLGGFGVLRARDTLGALHCVGFANVTVPLACAVAILSGKLLSIAGLKVLLMLVLVAAIAPITGHALGRAIFARSRA